MARMSRNKIAKIRKKSHNQILYLIFLGLIVLFALINLITKDKTYSESENRNLAQFPKFSVSSLEDGTFFSGLSDYTADQFFGRDTWISLKLTEDKLMGKKDSGGVFISKKGYLMANPDTPDEEAVINSVQAINDFADRYPDLTYTVMIAPPAANIISQYLPKNAPARDQVTDILDVYSKLSDTINTVNVGNILSQHSDEYIYYKTDHHWTSLGAYYTFLGAADTLAISEPITDYDIYTVADDFQGTLSSKSGSHSSKDEVQIYIPQSETKYYVHYTDTDTKSTSMYSSEALESKDKYTVFFGGNHPMVEVNTTADTGRNLLIFKDSYANSFIQFLTPYYDKIILIDPRYYYDSVSTILNSYGITDVLYLYSGNTFVTDTSLADVLNSGLNEDTSTDALMDSNELGTDETTEGTESVEEVTTEN